MRHITPTSRLVSCTTILVLLLLSTSTAARNKNLLLNPGAEQGKDDLPSIWFQAVIPADGLRIYRTSNPVHSGKFSFTISNSHEYEQTVCNNWAQKILNVPVGETIRLSAYIKTKDADSVNVCLQCWGASGNMIAFASTNVLRGNYDWTLLHAEPVTVPPETAYICVRAVLTGLGKAWFDDLSVVVIDTSEVIEGKQQIESVIDAELAKDVNGTIIKSLSLTKDCMILKYLPKWSHGNVDNIAVANNDGGVRTLLAWPQIPLDDVNDPNCNFLIALYSRKTTSTPPTGTVEAYEILKDWPERTSWQTQPPVAQKPAAEFKFVSGEGWKLFDITPLTRSHSKSRKKSHGLMLHFAQEKQSGNKGNWSGYAFISREGLGQWLSKRPKLLIVRKDNQ